MVQYFENDPTRLVERMAILNYWEEMITTGQVAELPGGDILPAEFDSLSRLAKEYGVSFPDASHET